MTNLYTSRHELISCRTHHQLQLWVWKLFFLIMSQQKKLGSVWMLPFPTCLNLFQIHKFIHQSGGYLIILCSGWKPSLAHNRWELGHSLDRLHTIHGLLTTYTQPYGRLKLISPAVHTVSERMETVHTVKTCNSNHWAIWTSSCPSNLSLSKWPTLYFQTSRNSFEYEIDIKMANRGYKRL